MAERQPLRLMYSDGPRETQGVLCECAFDYLCNFLCRLVNRELYIFSLLRFDYDGVCSFPCFFITSDSYDII